MSRQKIEFIGSGNNKLAGLLESPDGTPVAIALFSHCFTCGKDIAAASRIARALVARGYAVMRFDFTGLGGSDGDFANTNFSSNIQDLVAAANYLRENYLAPSLMIGHSLGGTAVLRAALEVPECRGVVTIGSPADAEHVVKQFETDLEKITQQGEAEVSLAGRNFTIKKQFIDDLLDDGKDSVAALKRDLLVFHSPVDNVVSIREAEKIYTRAKHPKSFISLGNADHLLTNKDDAEYVASTIAAWATRFIQGNQATSKTDSAIDRGNLRVAERNHVFTQDVTSDRHNWLADEPVEVGGADLGPDPYEHLLAALGSCTSMTIRMYASRKGWPVDDVRVDLAHERQHGEDCRLCDEENRQIELIKRTISITGSLDEDQRQRLLEIADRCPVHKTLHSKLVVETELA